MIWEEMRDLKVGIAYLPNLVRVSSRELPRVKANVSRPDKIPFNMTCCFTWP